MKRLNWKINSLWGLILGAIALFLVNPIILGNVVNRSMPFTLSSFIFMASFFLLIFIILLNIVNLILFPYLFRVLFSLFILIDSFVLYFMSEYAIVIDKNMVMNILDTDIRESKELLSFKLLLMVGLTGVLPLVIFWYSKIDFSSFKVELKRKLIVLLSSLLAIVIIIAPQYKNFSFFLREHPEIKRQLIPVNYLGSLKAVIHKAQKKIIVRSEAVATIDPSTAAIDKKLVFVLVLGETARWDHFSINGYKRETNPHLSKLDIINFPDVFSCGTSTAASVPCMFSPKGSSATAYEIDASPTLLDFFKSSGFAVEWRDNNSGCKGICDRVIYVPVNSIPENPYCNNSGCFDESLLVGLKERIEKEESKRVFIILHMLGSHGPTYYSRFPPEFSVFKEECATAELMNCTHEQINNSYDNTILYTDHVLGKLIGDLKSLSNISSAMFYVSDHGESLGEMGLYLHGLPYSFAPESQKHVPFLFWFSPTILDELNIDRKCIEGLQNEKLHHDHLFHSSLGLFKIKTEAYDKSLDLFSKCQK